MLFYMLFIGYFGLFSKLAGRDLVYARDYNLIPFRTISNYMNFEHTVNFTTFIVNLVGNVVAFIPFGILLPLVFPSSTKDYRIYRVFVGGLILSLGLELIQYFMCVGVFDVDDLILNGLGVLVGYLVYQFVRKKFSSVSGPAT